MNTAFDKINLLKSWENSLVTMNDKYFLELMRIYLGEIKTPYNKQNLITTLNAFLRREENIIAILKLLSFDDCLLLTAIDNLPIPNKNTLERIFASQFNIRYVSRIFLNLEERLLIFKTTLDNETVYCINPLLYENLAPYLNIDLLFLPECIQIPQNQYVEQGLCSNLISAWFCFVSKNPQLYKTDGTFRKRIDELLTETFPSVKKTVLHKLHSSLVNLGLLYQDNYNFYPHLKKWKYFSYLSSYDQYSYIIAGFLPIFAVNSVCLHVNLIYSFLQKIKNNAYTRSAIIRLFYFMHAKLQHSAPRQKSRMSALLKQEHEGSDFSPEHLFERFLDFGVLVKINYEKKELFCISPFFNNTENIKHTDITIDNAYQVSFLTDIPLVQSFELIQCMDLVRYDRVSIFLISRFSCIRCFDNNVSAHDILQNLKNVLRYEIPQNIIFSIQEWFSAYQSAALFKGFVLKVDLNKRHLIEQNPDLNAFISVQLAEGIYLMNFADDEEARTAIEKSGLDFIGGIKTISSEPDCMPFAPVEVLAPVENNHLSPPFFKKQNLENDLKNELKQVVQSTDYSLAHKETLYNHIERKVILNKKQILVSGINNIRTEAEGLDFMGKIHVAEEALASQDFVIVGYGTSEYRGVPIKLEKKDNDVLLKIEIIKTQEIVKEVVFFIGQIKYIKRIPSSVFS